MTQVDLPVAAPSRPVQHLDKNYINHSKGILSWLLTLDHKRIAVELLRCGFFADAVNEIRKLLSLHCYVPSRLRC